MNEQLRRDIDKFCEENYENIFRDISRLVAIDSVEGEPEEGAPFGKGPAKALDEALKIVKELGLEGYNCEGKMGYALLGENTDKYLATITHLDVVPAGEGWKEDPFKMRRKDGWIIGRGVMDDKGPSVLCLYALKYLKEHNVPLKYPVRALLGVNEETGMLDVEHYLANYPAPLFCFSPDANFPLCNGEKGIFQGKMVSKMPIGNIVDIKGGVAANVIPDKARAKVKAEKLASTEDVQAVELEKGLWSLEAKGIGGHASLPEGTRNAIGVLVDYLLDNKVCDENEEKFLNVLKLLHDDWTGAKLGVAADDGRFEPLTIVGGVIGIEDGHMFQSLDSRFPTNTNGAKLVSQMQEKAGDAAEVIMLRESEPFYMSLDNPAVQICINSYNDVTGENAQPYTIGGGTYARDFPNAVSFGPEHPERPMPDFAGPIHGAEEGASEEYFIEALKVYILALIELQKLEF